MQEETIDSIDYFPFLKSFWSTDGTYERLTKKAKQVHIRRLYALLARDQPQLMQMLNKEYSIPVIDSIHEAAKHDNRQPGYCYIKIRGSNSATVDKIGSYAKPIIDEFRKLNEIDYKDYEFFCEIEPDLILNGLADIQAKHDQIKKPKKRKR